MACACGEARTTSMMVPAGVSRCDSPPERCAVKPIEAKNGIDRMWSVQPSRRSNGMSYVSSFTCMIVMPVIKDVAVSPLATRARKVDGVVEAKTKAASSVAGETLTEAAESKMNEVRGAVCTDVQWGDL